MSDSECIFCKIGKGDIPSYKVYEDDLVMAILDISPLTKGHTQIIPKSHYTDIRDLDIDVYVRISEVTKKLVSTYEQKLGAQGFNLHNNSGLVAGQEVMHFHFHVIPKFEDDGINFASAQGTPKEINVEELHKELTE